MSQSKIESDRSCKANLQHLSPMDKSSILYKISEELKLEDEK